MNEGFALLTVTLRSVSIDAVRYILEERLEVATVCHQLFLLANVVALYREVVLLIGFEKIGENLLANHLIWDYKSGVSLISATDGDQPEVVEQADKVVAVSYVLSWEAPLEFTRHEAL